jgi:hypothetical protein
LLAASAASFSRLALCAVLSFAARAGYKMEEFRCEIPPSYSQNRGRNSVQNFGSLSSLVHTPDPCSTIDYRCDNEKITLELGQHLGIVVYLKTPGFQKCWSLTLSKHLFIRKLKATISDGLSIPNPNFSEFAFFFW